ncbi:MAG TPA: HAMP domain-containing sensor histidine kinase [Balneolales bacterium]|nr:HAMP domain-containing sensor histidine kinase [Balneolales bacterium]
MKLSMTSGRMRILLILLLVFIGLGSFIYTQYLVSRLRNKERMSVELWAKAIEYNGTPQNVDTRNELKNMANDIESQPGIPEVKKKHWVQELQRAEVDLANAALDFVASELIIKNRFEIPSIVTDSTRSILYSRNIKKSRLNQSLVDKLAKINNPIKIVVGTGSKSQKQYVYYGESATVKLLRYLPYLQFGLLAIFLGLAYYSWSGVKKTEQSNLWVGMAREAAHQLGTPISSLLGWIALLKESDDINTQNIVHELEQDVERLQDVADRFNKIGSEPELRVQRISSILNEVIVYMERRMPQLGKNVQIRKNLEYDVKANINKDLFQWAIENLIKNALDAIDVNQKGAYISVKTYRNEDDLIIDIEDSGKGIEKKYQKEIFKPGFSTKKRGWGLGLSLTKRIVEEYHNGKLIVAHSSPGKGTTFRITLKMNNDRSKA